MKIIDIIAIVLAVVGTGAFIYLLPHIKALLPKIEAWFNANTTEAQRELLWEFAKQAVQAAEQIYGAGKGVEKKAWAMEFLRKLLPTSDDDVLSAAIEDHVYVMNADK